MQLTRITQEFYGCLIPTTLVAPIVTYWLRVVLFGASSSPFTLDATLKFHFSQNTSATSKDLLHNLYVDNLVSGCETEEGAIQYFTESRSVLSHLPIAPDYCIATKGL